MVYLQSSIFSLKTTKPSIECCIAVQPHHVLQMNMDYWMNISVPCKVKWVSCHKVTITLAPNVRLSKVPAHFLHTGNMHAQYRGKSARFCARGEF